MIAFVLLCCLADLPVTEQDLDRANQEYRSASRSYWDCRTSGKECAEERANWQRLSNWLDYLTAEHIKATLDSISGSVAELNAITTRLNAYAACRKAKHWWQFWKRCRY